MAWKHLLLYTQSARLLVICFVIQSFLGHMKRMKFTEVIEILDLHMWVQPPRSMR